MRTIGIILAGLMMIVSLACKKKKTVTETAAPDVATREQPMLEVKPLRNDRALVLPVESDPFELNSAVITGDSLILSVSYGGGCRPHVFELLTNGMYAKSLPMQLSLYLKHQANEDMCRAYFTQRIAFDLKTIRPPQGNELHIFLDDNRGNRLIYKY